MRLTYLFVIILTLIGNYTMANISVTDDLGNRIRLPHPARRIISLAPHITENLFTIGAGGQVIACTTAADYPSTVKQLTKVGNYHGVDMEAVLRLKPDLIIAWQYGIKPSQLQQLRAFNIPVFINDTKHISDIPKMLKQFSLLTGHRQKGLKVIKRFKQRMKKIKSQNHHKETVRIFYQVWKDPLITITKHSMINDAIELCGGENTFANAAGIAPQISREAYIQSHPDITIDGNTQVDPNLLQRATPRMLTGITQLCTIIDKYRQQRKRSHG